MDAQVLGVWYERGKVLIFVQSQDKCDTLFRDLLKVGPLSANWLTAPDALRYLAARKHSGT